MKCYVLCVTFREALYLHSLNGLATKGVGQSVCLKTRYRLCSANQGWLALLRRVTGEGPCSVPYHVLHALE